MTPRDTYQPRHLAAVAMSPTSAASDFREAWSGNSDAATSAVELLPVRLAKACVQVLKVDGAGISMHQQQFRVPLGASDTYASIAERLQFTTGQGPCMDEAVLERGARADRHEIARRWPTYAAELFTRTPFRVVLSLPIDQTTGGLRGALNLYLVNPARASAIQVADMIAVTDRILEAFNIATAVSAQEYPNEHSSPRQARLAWLERPAPRARAIIWIAMGIVVAAFNIPSEEALDTLRAEALARGRSINDLAGDLVDGVIATTDLRRRPRSSKNQ